MIYCTPLVIAEIIFKKDYKLKMKSAFTCRNICILLAIPMLNVLWSFGLLYGSVVMIQSHAYILSSMFSIYIVLIGYCLCMRPYRLELIGLFLSLAGIALMLNDGKAERTDGKVANAWDYAVAMVCSFAAALFFIFNGHLVKAFPIFTLCLMQSILAYFCILILLFVSYPGQFTYLSLDREWGGFGLLNSEEALYAFLCLGLTVGFWGSLGYVFSLIFFSPVIVSATLLFLPFISQMLGYWLNIDYFPGWLTWTGNVCAFIGLFAI